MEITGNGDSSWPIACFFKLILQPRFDLQRLELPRKFMRIYGDELSNIIYLNIPTGKVWKFNLVRENGKAFIQKGWQDFVEFYLLDHGHFLVFKYEGNSRFEVIILDMSASEIEYPIEIETSRKNLSKKRKISDLNKPSSSKKAKTVMDDELIISYNNARRYNGLTSEDFKRVHAYYTHYCKHPSFATKLPRSSVDRKSSLGIPREFTRRYLDKERCTHTFDFQTNTGKKWPVNTIRSDGRVKLSRGWKKFATDNKLKVGDICIFELINKQEFKVHILRLSNAKKNRVNLANRTEEVE